MLADSNVFKQLLGESKEPSLPPKPETLSDPKAVVNGDPDQTWGQSSHTP